MGYIAEIPMVPNQDSAKSNISPAVLVPWIQDEETEGQIA
jgi:hypothetical protein